MKLALKYPDKVKELFLVAPFLTPNNTSEKISAIPGLAKNPFIGTIMGVLFPILTTGKLISHFENVFYPEKVPDSYQETYLPRFTRFESLIATISDKNSMIELLSEVHEGISNIKCPITIISGKKDKVCPADKQIEIIKEKQKDIKIIEIEDGGHGLPYTHPEEIAKAILA